MATEVIIPAMGESISSGILAAWHIKDGDYVEKEQVLYELETDKITSEANAEVSGIISIKVPAEEEVDIGQVVALIDESVHIAPGGKVSVEVDAPTSDSRSTEIELDPV
ncbi:MAG: biotin/lipoyl-containing protein, partial [Verrucomicrobiota bacterium]|nr:biotin/lipoyl-containing protein [Verrucomicrobiota bacterium]